MKLRLSFCAMAIAAALTFGAATAAAASRASFFVGISQEPYRLETGKGALLRLQRPAATVFVADPKIADIQVKSPRLIYITARQPGETSLYAVDAQERIMVSRRIVVDHNVSRLAEALRKLIPNSAIRVQSVDGILVLSGSVRTASDSENAQRIASRLVGKPENLLNKLAVTGPNQVHLRVRIAEVSREVLKQFGINWEAVFSSGSFVLGLATGNPVLAASSFITRTDNTNSAFGSFNGGPLDINGIIDALDNEGLITVLAEPNLTAVSGETASFLAGGEFPILIPGKDLTATIEFKRFGVALSFTPTIVGENRISLRVAPEVSRLSGAGAIQFSGFNIPSLTTRRAETTVELGSGQSFAIAGLLQNNMTRDVSKFPGLGDLPVLGALFRSDRFQRNESELVIIVTPYVVRPVSQQKLALPTDGLTPPTDVDRIIHGRTHRPALGRGRKGPQGRGAAGLVGPVGFVLD